MRTNPPNLTRIGLVALPLAVAAACSAGQSDGGGGTDPGTGSTTSASTSGVGGGPVASSTTGGFMSGGSTTGGGGPIICDPGGPMDDVDMDGFTPDEGDCEDCDPSRNPNAIEVPTEPGKEAFDENCDMQIDEPLADPCDADLAVDDMDPIHAAHAIEICKMSTGVDDWGLVSAAWVQADGAPPPVGFEVPFHLGHGILQDFGPNVDVRRGERMLVVSSGTARAPDDPGWRDPVDSFDKNYLSGSPMGFPKESPSCPNVTTGPAHDSTGVELVIRTPSNATGFSFDFNFFSSEWPVYICQQFNDFFVALLDPIPPGQMDGNVSFDSLGNPVSVNNALLQVCGCDGNPPNDCEAGGLIYPCQLGNIQLIGSGFGFDTASDGDHAATGWLRTTAPVEGGVEIKLRFANYDSGDGRLDSTTLVDNFQWIAKPGTMVGTNPVPQ